MAQRREEHGNPIEQMQDELTRLKAGEAGATKSQ